ncbi:MAG: bifunctional aspartate kinase/homoserine dehydrogenase I [Pseudomonadota bacterium]
MSNWQVYKFGGSSLADSQCIRRVAAIVRANSSPSLAVVVSAMGGMTDALLNLVDAAAAGEQDFKTPLRKLGSRYELTAGTLLEPAHRMQVLDDFAADLLALNDVLKAIALVRSAPERSRDLVAGYGELWSARLLSAVLSSDGQGAAAQFLDARDVLTVRKGKMGPSVVWKRSEERLVEALGENYQGLLIITGFIAADEAGLQATLGRNGSDHSASIFAALLKAQELTIWTDVDGVLSADPRRVPEAQVIQSVSYNEAMELAYFGAKVIHPQTMGPAVRGSIPILIRNTFSPEKPGTRIVPVSDRRQRIKGITSIDGIALINVEGAGMVGVPGTADRLFGALHRAEVSVVLISQASSEHSICIAVPEHLAEAGQAAIREAYAVELAQGQLQSVDINPDMSIIALVGDGMSGLPGVAGRFLNNVGRAGINVAAIAQGSSERNISIVVRRSDSTRALRAIHSGFYLSAKTLSIGLIGPGTVGGALLDQLAAQADALREQFNLDLRVRAISASTKQLLGERRIELTDWREKLAASTAVANMDGFVDHVDADHLPHAVIIDCSASESVAKHYSDWLERGIHVITPNKKAFSSDYAYYEKLHIAARRGRSHFLYETTVGAGLPIVKTLRDLVETGDRVDRVEGIFSGTLAYLFNTYDGSRPFSAIVSEARENGYTEPDPRDDLSGMDVARKVTILARELGMQVELSDLDIQSLVPESLRECSTEEFMQGLPEFDDAMDAMLSGAQKRGRQLRYVGSLDREAGPSVSLLEVENDHPFANINLTDNIVQFVTARYSANPLVVQGPGAGPDVTAGGVFADVLRLASFLGSHD